MPADPLQPIRDALRIGDKAAAQKLILPLLKQQPTADLWYMAAQACTTQDKAIVCLRHALALEPQHSAANRLLFKLEGAKPPSEEEQPSVEALTADIPLKKVKNRKKRSGSRTLVLICLLLFAVSCSTITLNLIGLISGPVTVVTELTGGATPVSQLDGTPLGQVDDAPLRVQPSQTKPIQQRDADVLEPGYEHEYTFTARQGQDMAIYVQFLSLGANRVSRNVIVLRPNDSDATSTCQRDTIIQGDNNLTLTCPIDVTGTWKVRILGRAGESVGAYFVGVQEMQG